MSAPTTARPLPALLRIPLGLLDGGPNARGEIRDADVVELAASIRAIGMQKPLLVVPVDGGRYQVLDGHRRLAAARLLDLDHVDAVLRADRGPAGRLQQQLALHVQAAGFDPIAEAEALHALMWQHGMSREDIARAVGKSPNWVRDRLLLLALGNDERQQVRARRMPLGIAVATARNQLAEKSGREPAPVVARPAPPRRHCATCQCGSAS